MPNIRFAMICSDIRYLCPQCYAATGLVMRSTASRHVRGLLFSTFFGGGDASYAAPRACATYYRNFKLTQTAHAPLVG